MYASTHNLVLIICSKRVWLELSSLLWSTRSFHQIDAFFFLSCSWLGISFASIPFEFFYSQPFIFLPFLCSYLTRIVFFRFVFKVVLHAVIFPCSYFILFFSHYFSILYLFGRCRDDILCNLLCLKFSVYVMLNSIALIATLMILLTFCDRLYSACCEVGTISSSRHDGSNGTKSFRSEVLLWNNLNTSRKRIWWPSFQEI